MLLNNITSDVLYKIYKILYHWFSLYAVFKVHFGFSRNQVENTRVELVTSCLQGRRSPNWANPPYLNFMVSPFMQMAWVGLTSFIRKALPFRQMGLSGLEPPTSRLSGVRSNRLSYKPILIWRPPTLPHRLQCSTIGRPGLNHRVRDGNGCCPWTHRHQKILGCLDNPTIDNSSLLLLPF